MGNTQLAEWFRVVYVDTKYFYLDRYSILHLTSGIIIGIILTKVYPPKDSKYAKYSAIIALCIFILYELFEILTKNILFVGEPLIDRVWDVTISMMGFFITWRILK